MLFFQGDPSEYAYAVRSGKISIIINSLDGREMVLNEKKAGEAKAEARVRKVRAGWQACPDEGRQGLLLRAD